MAISTLNVQIFLTKSFYSEGNNLLLFPQLTSLLIDHLAAGSNDDVKARIAHFYNYDNDEQNELTKITTLALEGKLKDENKKLIINNANMILLEGSYNLSDTYYNYIRTNRGEILYFDDSNAKSMATYVDNWTNEKTMGKITESGITEEILCDDITMFIIHQAFYFWSKWFDTYKKTKSNFYFSHKNYIKVPSMKSTKTSSLKIFDSSILDAMVIDIPYDGKVNNKNCIFRVYLPNTHDNDDDYQKLLTKLIEKMTNDNNKNILKELHHKMKNMSSNEYMLYMPNFKIESDLVLKELLYEKFDISGSSLNQVLAKKLDLSISSIKQKGVIEVNHKGTEAAAVNTCMVDCLFFDDNPVPTILINRPFAYDVIAGNVCMMNGVVNNPVKKN